MIWLIPLFFFPLFEERGNRFVLYSLLIFTMILSMFHDPCSPAQIALLFIRNAVLIYIEAYIILVLLGSPVRADRMLRAVDIRRLFGRCPDRCRRHCVLWVCPKVAKSPPTWT